MGAAVAERMEARGLTAHLSHAVAEPCHAQAKALCGVATHSLCMDDSQSDESMPDCLKCQRIISKTQPKQHTWKK